MLYQEIKKANLEALKNKDSNARAIYSVLINKCMLLDISKRENGSGTVGEELSDSDVISLIQKTCKELDDEISSFEKVNDTSKVELLKAQKKYIEKFLPEMLSENEIRCIIEKLDDKSIPNIMRYFKANYAGSCDMGKVNQIARSYQG